MEKIVLHVGVHKTATTYFQSILYNSQKALIDKGVFYLPLDETRKNFTSKIGSGAPVGQESIGMFNKADVLLISDENILGGTEKPTNNKMYKNAKERVLLFIKLLPKVDVEIHITIRDPKSYLISRYCEYLRHYPFISIHQYFDEFPLADFSWRPLINDLQEVVGDNVHISEFENIFDNELFYLKSLTGTDAVFSQATIDPSVKRSKISHEAYVIAAEIAEHYPGHLVRRFIDMVDRNKQLSKASPLSPFSKGLLTALRSNYLNDKSALKNALLNNA